MRLAKLAAIGLAAIGAAAALPAAAMPIVTTYQVVSRFATGPYAQVTSQFQIAYDPMQSSGAMLVNSFGASVADAAFNPAVVQFEVSTLPNQATQVTVGGSVAGPFGITPGSADFAIVFFVDPASGGVPAGRQLVPFSVDVRYTQANATTVYDTFDNTIRILASTPAVPEPGTWALAMAGFGVVGAGLRRRRRATAAYI